jgi:prepilin-type processing-associated H-X9-DG protein
LLDAAPPGPFDPKHSPDTYGHLDFRYEGRCIVATFDGHVEALTPDEMLDMRRWPNQADSAAWQPKPK